MLTEPTLELTAPTAPLSAMDIMLLGKALTALAAIKAQYKIILPNGAEYGTLVAAPEEVETGRKRKSPIFPRGTMSTYVIDQLSSMAVSDVKKIDVLGFEASRLCSTCITQGEKMWGKDSVLATAKTTPGYIEVARLG
jgi:hypothetical protein